MAFAAGAKIFKDAGETVSDVEQQLSQALVEVENNAAADLKAPLKELYFKVSPFIKIRKNIYAQILAGAIKYVVLDSFQQYKFI